MRLSWVGVGVMIVVLIFLVTLPRTWMVGQMNMMMNHAPMGGMMGQRTSQSSPELTNDSRVDREIIIDARDFAFDPSRIRVRVGERVRLTLANQGRIVHDVTVDNLPVRDTQGREYTKVYVPAGAGQTRSATFVPLAQGEFTFYCAVPGHRQAGMEGTLMVDTSA